MLQFAPIQKFLKTIPVVAFLLLSSCNPPTGAEAIPQQTALPPQASPSTAETVDAGIVSPTSALEPHYGVARVPTQVDEMIGNLSGLSLDAFYERSFLYWLSRDPEAITRLGLDDKYDIQNNLLTDISEQYVEDTEKLERAILSLLLSYDRLSLDVDEQLDYDVYQWYWQDRVNAQPYRIYQFPFQSYGPGSIQDQLIDLLVKVQPLSTRQDFDNFVSRVYQIDLKIDQGILQMQSREALGLIPPQIVISSTLHNTQSYLPAKYGDNYNAEHTVLFEHFKAALDKSEIFSQTEKINYELQIKNALNESFIPAYVKLSAYLRGLLERSEDVVGLWNYDSGKEYYQYLIQHYTSGNFTPEQLTAFGNADIEKYSEELKRIASGMGTNFQEPDMQALVQKKISINQGFPIYEQFPTLFYSQLKTETYLKNLNLVSGIFTIPPEFSPITTADGEISALADPLPVQMSDPWVEVNDEIVSTARKIDKSTLPVLSVLDIVSDYISLNSTLQSDDLPTFRKVLTFPGYVEMWQSYTLDSIWPETEISNTWESFSKTQRDLFLASCLVVDTGIHVYGWTIGESVAFLEETNGLPYGKSLPVVERIVQNPGQVLIYAYEGYQLEKLFQTLQAELHEKFRPNDFADWLIAKGNIPFSIAEKQAFNYATQVEKMDAGNIQP